MGRLGKGRGSEPWRGDITQQKCMIQILCLFIAANNTSYFAEFSVVVRGFCDLIKFS